MKGNPAVIGWIVKGRDSDGRFRQISPVYTVYDAAVTFANIARKGEEYSDVQVHEKVRRESTIIS